MDRGILPRAVEDMFNIVRNSEERDEDFDMLHNEIASSESDMPEHDFYHGGKYVNPPSVLYPRDTLRSH